MGGAGCVGGGSAIAEVHGAHCVLRDKMIGKVEERGVRWRRGWGKTSAVGVGDGEREYF